MQRPTHHRTGHRPSWIQRTFESVVLPAVTPVADVRTAGAARCGCGHPLLAHVRGTETCRSCGCGGFEAAVVTAA